MIKSKKNTPKRMPGAQSAEQRLQQQQHDDRPVEYIVRKVGPTYVYLESKFEILEHFKNMEFKND